MHSRHLAGVGGNAIFPEYVPNILDLTLAQFEFLSVENKAILAGNLEYSPQVLKVSFKGTAVYQ